MKSLVGGLPSGYPRRADPYIEGKYQYFKCDDKSEIILRPNGEVVRIPTPQYGPDGKKLNDGFRIDPATGQISRPHTFPETEKVTP